jgi:phosphopantetheinyl transferase (holo-ACP synthase)
MRLVSVPRFIAFLERRPGAKTRLFTSDEIRYCERFRKGPEERFAARFAAKCAVRSEVPGLGWHEILIGNDALGAPWMTFGKLNTEVPSISLSHDKRWAVAALILGERL